MRGFDETIVHDLIYILVRSQPRIDPDFLRKTKDYARVRGADEVRPVFNHAGVFEGLKA